VWVKFKDLNFEAGSGARKIQLDGNPDLAGNQTANFEPAEVSQFLVPHE
jgi:hypothetical protein